MRILAVQLARFGDIYQTWPVLKALLRQNPQAEIHVLVRERFASALEGLDGLVVHTLPTSTILKPVFESGDEHQGVRELRRFLMPLTRLAFDRVINLSFSPFSSYLTDLLYHEEQEVRGYTRFKDGFLSIPDDASAYFYAQVGVGKANRYHLTEVFAAVSGVELEEQDFSSPWSGTERKGIVVHLGASTQDKTYAPELWVQCLQALAPHFDEQITLIGSQDERALSETVAAQLSDLQIVNRTGETKLIDLFHDLGNARLLIGADSAPIHMASLTTTPILNLSSASVNFWETGPTTPGSRVMYAVETNKLKPDQVAREALSMLSGGSPARDTFVRNTRLGRYEMSMPTDDFSWQLIEALYTGSPYPCTDDSADLLAFQRLFEVAELAGHELDKWQTMTPEAKLHSAQILTQVDDILVQVPRLNPRIEPVAQFFQTERMRIPPMSEQEVWTRTRKLFEDLKWIAAVYRVRADVGSELRRAMSLCVECVAELREWNFGKVEGQFNELLATLHELARHSTKVGPEKSSWSSVLGRIHSSLERRDFVELADTMEWDLPTLLNFELSRTT